MTTEQIQQEIERTRGELEGTLHAIERKLSARQLMDQAVDTMRDLTNANSRIGSAVRDNPIPLAIIGLGIGWLALSETMGSSPQSQAEEEDAYAAPAYAAVAQSLSPVVEPAEEMAGEASQRLQKAAEAAKRHVGEWSRSVGDAAERAVDRTRDAYNRHPLTRGAAAAVLGAALGFILPRTRTEAEMVSGRMKDVVRQARDTGSEIVERAGRVARTAIRAAREGSEPMTEKPEELDVKTMH